MKECATEGRSGACYLLDSEAGDDLGAFGDGDHGARLDCLSARL
jgi:hypothetical protein